MLQATDPCLCLTPMPLPPPPPLSLSLTSSLSKMNKHPQVRETSTPNNFANQWSGHISTQLHEDTWSILLFDYLENILELKVIISDFLC